MKIAAVIVEYNPFHNGHLYQLNTIRKELGVDRIIVVMSGNFMQRGIPAIVDKYTRAKMALANGADVVLELPVYYSLGSAEYFAQGAVALLDKLGIVDVLHFGSECGDLQTLSQIAEILSVESDIYVSLLKELQKNGDSFATSRCKAVNFELSQKGLLDASAIMSEPNNTLGIEYMKALHQRKSTIVPATLLRKGNGYHETKLDNNLASASAIREFVQNENVDLAGLKPHVPASVYSEFVQNREFLFADDFSSILYYHLLHSLTAEPDLSDYYDITSSLSDTFRKNLSEFTTFSQFCLACKTKNVAYTRIARCLMHLLLDMKQETAQALKRKDYVMYAHLLGFNANGRDVLKLIKSNTSIPVFTKIPDMLKQLDGVALSSLKTDIYASQIYYGIQGQKYHHMPVNEFRLKYNPY